MRCIYNGKELYYSFEAEQSRKFPEDFHLIKTDDIDIVRLMIGGCYYAFRTKDVSEVTEKEFTAGVIISQ